MEANITIRHPAGVIRASCEAGAPIAGLLREMGLLAMPCGLGKCGKCRIYANTEPVPEELEVLGNELIEKGIRLACRARAENDLEVTIIPAGTSRVLTDFAAGSYDYSPVIKRVPADVAKPSLENQKSDLSRLMDCAGAQSHGLTLRQLADLAALLEKDEPVDAIMEGNHLCGCARRGGSGAFVVDIGTTTVAAILIDLQNGAVLASRGELNAQSPFGADVISRISSEMEWARNSSQNPLQLAIRNQLAALLASLLEETGMADVDAVSITGNTTMLHLLCGLPAKNISRAPFIPVALGPMRLRGREIGLDTDASCFIMPGVSAYVGGDIIASLLAADAHHGKKPFILVDFGTNAETVLGIDGKLYACSAAAGPCFEGATLSCGMGGQNGAIDAVATDGYFNVNYTVIGGGKPEGICGSGVLDALAVMLDCGVMDESGLMEGGGVIGARIKDGVFHIAGPVGVSQKDIREVQLAKAAVRAGMEVLLEKAGLDWNDIGRLYLAGGFGSAMRPESAARIGLIPRELVGKTRVLGNAACFGAMRYITEKGAEKAARDMARETSYIELSSDRAFSEKYIEHMVFPPENVGI